MRFAVPLGLLGLISVAILILIYIFKPKYQDKKVSSTYVWKLSLKYAKRKVPLSWVQSSVLFIIQLLILVLLAFAMARPQIVLADKTGEKIAVLDASASMTATVDGKSRFDRAKSQISDMIDDTTGSHKISIVLAGEQPRVLVRRSDSATFAKQKLFESSCSMTEPDVDGAMDLCEDILAENPTADIYFFTDHDYADSGKVHVVNVSRSEWNAAVLDFTAKREKGMFVFTAEVASYGRAAEIPVGLTVDGVVRLPKLAQAERDGVVNVVWDSLDISSYGSAEIHLNVSDSTSFDNDFYIFSPDAEPFNVQLVSDNAGFLFGALSATEKCHIVVPSDTVPEKTSGFDLYIYDGTEPDVMPTDGTVWFINPTSDIPASTGITVNGTRTDPNDYVLSAGTAASTDDAKKILGSIKPGNITVRTYDRITRRTGYETILQVNGEPALLIKDDNGAKTVVLAFDIHLSNLPVLPEFPLLLHNLCNYSMSRTVEQTQYEVGDDVVLNAKADAESITVKASYADGTESERVYTSFPVRFTAEKSGAYNVTQVTSSGRTLEGAFFVRVAEDESVFGKKLSTLANPITPLGAGTDTTIQNNTKDITFYFIIAILVLLVVEWGLQYREQY